jgi:hypothetical protein
MNRITETMNLHLHTSPEGLGGLVVPCVYNTTSHMFTLGGCLLNTGSFPDVDCQFALRPAEDIYISVLTSFCTCKNRCTELGA